MTRISTTPPADLTAAIARLLEERSRRDLAERATRISAIYRAEGRTAEAIRDETDALAYALTRLPATYAATVDALGRLAEQAPDFRPRRMLDLGAGLGTASVAAGEIWPEIETFALLDRSRAFLQTVGRLAETGVAALSRARLIEGDLPAPTLDRYDLVVASYAMTEMPENALAGVVDAAFAACDGALAIVEPGTPRDYRRLMFARERLVASGARIAAPCPHDRPCPLAAPDWCHFSARLARSRDHRLVKGADAPFEDEKFGYLIAVRAALGAVPAAARALARPAALKHGLRIKLCTAAGIEEAVVQKRDKRTFGPIKKKGWGDAVALEETSAKP
ncbi:MAG TPA: small ribosomal subunit Rsm22 family protein [Methylosinus sp.]|jgi:ribosomal protein RSM22 (predicted rRNA methylase)